MDNDTERNVKVLDSGGRVKQVDSGSGQFDLGLHPITGLWHLVGDTDK